MQLGREFVRALSQIAKDRNLSQELIVSSLEAALISAYKKYQDGQLGYMRPQAAAHGVPD